MTRIELLRGVCDLVEYQPDLLSDRFLPGIDFRDVPMRDLARRHYELIARNSGSDVLDAEIDRLAAIDRSLKFKPLERVVEVFSGRPFRRQVTVRHIDATDAMAGLIRAGDVKDIADSGNAAREAAYAAEFAEGQAPSLFLSGEARNLVKEKEFLRPFDVVRFHRRVRGRRRRYSHPVYRHWHLAWSTAGVRNRPFQFGRQRAIGTVGSQ